MKIQAIGILLFSCLVSPVVSAHAGVHTAQHGLMHFITEHMNTLGVGLGFILLLACTHYAIIFFSKK